MIAVLGQALGLVGNIAGSYMERKGEYATSKRLFRIAAPVAELKRKHKSYFSHRRSIKFCRLR